MNAGDGKLWGEIREVPAPKPRVKVSAYEELYHELLLRLEKTPARKALAIPFTDYGAAMRARDNLQQLLFRRRGPGLVRFRVEVIGDGAVVFAQRGPKWERAS